jgi:two-component sensor histidine kinase
MILKRFHFPIYIFVLLQLFALQSCKKEKQNIAKPKINTHYSKYLTLAENYFKNKKNDSAFYYYNKIKATSDASIDNEKIIYSLLKMAIIQQNEGDYSSSETTATETIALFQKDINPAYKCAVFNLLGINYENLYDYKNAISYYNQAYNEADTPLQKVVLKNNIAVVYMDKEEYQRAIQILSSVLLNRAIPNGAESIARALDNLGYCYFKIGNPKSLGYMTESLKIRKDIKDDFGIMASYIHFSEFYKEGNTEKSDHYARLAYGKATAINSINIRLKSLALLIENSIGDRSKKFSMLHLRLTDSINKVRQKAKNQFAKMKYDTKIEKEENLKLKAQKAENALQLEQQKNRNQLLAFVVGITILISIFIAHFLIAENKREKIKTSYTTEIRIAKKLHDELANDVYHTMAFAETQDLSNSQNKEKLLSNLDTIYSRTRNISKENSTIAEGPLFISNLKDMMSGFNNNEVNILTKGIDTVNWTTLENNKKITVYRVLQELLVNMKKHSQCTLVIVTFEKKENKLHIDYSDNGVGASFDEKTSRNGLQNVENRIQAIKGTATFDTKSDKGFKVSFIFPI